MCTACCRASAAAGCTGHAMYVQRAVHKCACLLFGSGMRRWDSVTACICEHPRNGSGQPGMRTTSRAARESKCKGSCQLHIRCADSRLLQRAFIDASHSGPLSRVETCNHADHAEIAPPCRRARTITFFLGSDPVYWVVYSYVGIGAVCLDTSMQLTRPSLHSHVLPIFRLASL